MYSNCVRLSILGGTRKRNSTKQVFTDFLLQLTTTKKGVNNFMLPNAKSMAPKGPFLHV